MELFDQVAYNCSKLVTKSYSTSFTLGIRTLDRKFHPSIYAIYGFVRLADEIVDTFHEHNKTYLFNDFKKATWEAIDHQISLNPVLHAFQQVVNHYDIDHGLIQAFLHSMEMDLYYQQYSNTLFERYIYGSAEVVGLMCLKVFADQDPNTYERLKYPARKLGAAFQKVNFLRDMKSDYEDRGRHYFPGIHFEHFDDEKKKEIEQSIDQDFKMALKGIFQLPKGARMGVYLAYVYYQQLFKKIQLTPAYRIMEERVRIPNFYKMGLLLSTYLKSYWSFK